MVCAVVTPVIAFRPIYRSSSRQNDLFWAFSKLSLFLWEFEFCLSVHIPYILELILVRSDDRYIRSLQIIFIRRNRIYILKHSISPGNIYRTNVPYHIPIYRTNVQYHIPCHIIFPPHRAIIPYHRHKYLPHQRTIPHTVPYIISTTPCHHTIPPT